MKNFILSALIIFISFSLPAQTLKVSYKSHSSSLASFTISNKSFGLPGDMYLYKIKKIEEQTIETKSIQPLEAPRPNLKKLELTNPKDKKSLKKQLKAEKKAAKKKRKAIEKQQKENQKKKVSEATFITQNSVNNQVGQLLLLSLLVIVLIVAVLPVSQNR